MSSFIMKKTVENEFDKFLKQITGDDNDDEEEKARNCISDEDSIAEQKKHDAIEKEREAKQAKRSQEREEARQKIRDKYNIKKKDDDLSTSAHNDIKTRQVGGRSTVENQGSDTTKTTTNVFHSLKKKLGWK